MVKTKWLGEKRMYKSLTMTEILEHPIIAMVNASDNVDAETFRRLMLEAAEDLRRGRNRNCSRVPSTKRLIEITPGGTSYVD